jgi:hypothetical protein
MHLLQELFSGKLPGVGSKRICGARSQNFEGRLSGGEKHPAEKIGIAPMAQKAGNC